MSYNPINVYKDRVTVVTLNLGIDISSDTVTSEIRSEEDTESTLLGTWTVTEVTDGTDGLVTLTMEPDDLTEDAEDRTNGFMDVKRVSGGKAYPVFPSALPVVFKGSVTA